MILCVGFCGLLIEMCLEEAGKAQQVLGKLMTLRHLRVLCESDASLMCWVLLVAGRKLP